MDGANRNAGAVSALTGFLSPIRAARAVMETTPHVLLAGKGAESFAEKAGLAQVDDPTPITNPPPILIRVPFQPAPWARWRSIVRAGSPPPRPPAAR
jgi:hypothetical protein